jgi:hypothetical protein
MCSDDQELKMLYLDRRGRAVDEKDALDANGIIKDGFRTRVSLMDSQFARVAWKSGRKIAQFWCQWAVEAPDHALHRLIQREVDHGRQPDLRGALFEAANAFMRADANTLDHYGHESNIYLPAGPGLFGCNVIKSRDAKRIYTYARARTYLGPEMLRRNAGQDPVAGARDLANSVLTRALDEVPFETEFVRNGARMAAPLWR